MRPWFRVARVQEATPAQLIATGAAPGYGVDPLDGDSGWRPAGSAGRREVPWWTAEKARSYSLAAYRANPMATAILDTYVAFCVGDSGVSATCTNADVNQVVDEFWSDPKNLLADRQELFLRSHLLMGESLWELMVGEVGGMVRICPLDVSRISAVRLDRGNPLWPAEVELGGTGGGDGRRLTVADVDDATGLRGGEAMFWPSFKALDTDVRGTPFLMSVLDQLDAYDTVLSNLIDRTALGRYMVWDVTVDGDQQAVDEFIAARGGMQVPPSGSIEVHNSSVKWDAKSVQTGADEDSAAARQVLTQVAAGAGLARSQPMDCRVLTPSGWRQMGALKVGDEIVTPSGRPAKVVGVYPQGEKETFTVTFSDGAQTRASGDHLWLTQTALDRKRQPHRRGTVKTTDEIARTLRYRHGDGRYGHWNHYVPLIAPVEGADRDLPIDPYVLGALLGDGHIRIKSDGAVEVLLSSADPELVDEVNGHVVGEFRKIRNSDYDHRYIEPSRTSTLRRALRDLGLCGSKSHTKFVPAAYKTASAKSRLSLLQGIFDTDGSPSHGTSVALVTVSPDLARDIRDVVWSLGGVCTMTTESPVDTHVLPDRHGKARVPRSRRMIYRLRVTLPEGDQYFRLERKHALTIPAGQKIGRAVRTIRNIEPIGRAECQCIAIDDPDHLYITDDFIVTHNTWLADPEDSNRATSLTMAEPVRRRVGSVQKMWLGRQTELTKFAIDRAVAVGRLPKTVKATDPRTGQSRDVPASRAVTITGPEIAAADAQLQASVLLNLSTGLEKFVQNGIMSREAAQIAAKKAWESYVGVPYTADLDSPDANPDDIATAIDDAQTGRKPSRLRPAPAAAAGESEAAEANPDGNPDALHRYWTAGAGLAKWKDTPHPWTALYKQLLKHMDGDQDLAKRTAALWYHDVFGYWPGKRRKAS